MLPKKLAFVDIETTGGSVTADRVIEIGIVRVENNTVVQTYKSLIHPNKIISQSIELLTGITNDMLLSAPTFWEVKKDIADILEDCHFVAHNVRFDYSFLKNEFARFEQEFSPKHFCTVKLSRLLYPQYRHHNLDSIIERHGFTVKNRHRAYDDAYVLWQFYQKAMAEFGAEQLGKAISIITKRPSLPVNISRETIAAIPNNPGVYIFYGDEGVPLYVGKSVTLRDRILSHFSADHSNTKEMKITQNINSIETIETPGELSALIKESQLVKELQPIFNSQLRRCQKFICALKDVSKTGYPIIRFETVDSFTPDILHRTLGIFRSLKQAKQFATYAAETYQLCKKLLSLEHMAGACFGYRLEKCKGACVEKESAEAYQERFSEAFGSKTISTWPYKGAVIIIERKPNEESGQYFLINQWCIIDSGTFSDEYDAKDRMFRYDTWDTLGNLHKSKQPVPFDLDTYKILLGYFTKTKHRNTITPVVMPAEGKQTDTSMSVPKIFLG